MRWVTEKFQHTRQVARIKNSHNLNAYLFKHSDALSILGQIAKKSGEKMCKRFHTNFVDGLGSVVEIRAESMAELYAENKSILPENKCDVVCFEYLIVDGRPHLKSQRRVGWVSKFGFDCA